MRVGIGKVTKELGVKPHQLHKWEERGWLGYEPVLKDPDNNNQRMYTEEQLERIRFIQALIEDQRTRGIKRTDFDEVEERLLDRFGGEIVPQKEEVSLLPSTMDEFHHLMLQNNKMLGDMAEQLKKRDEEMVSLLAEQAKDKEKMNKEMQLLKEKLDIAVAYIQKQEEQEQQAQKKGLLQRLFS